MEIIDNFVMPNRFSEMSQLGEGDFSSEEERNCIGLVLFKPDAINTGLDLPILNFLENELMKSTGKTVNFFAFTLTKIEPEKVRKLYPEQKHKQYMEYIESHFETGQACLVLVVAKDAPQELNRLKGSIRTGEGIRGKFGLNRPISVQELKAWKDGKLDLETTHRIGVELLAKNLIHIPDDRNDTIRAIELLLGNQTIDDLKKSIPLVKKWYNTN